MVEIKKLNEKEMDNLGISKWSIWEKEVSRFDWYYDSIEECYFLEGEVVLTAQNGKQYCFGIGDFVRFDKDLSCTWDIKKDVKKHYRFI